MASELYVLAVLYRLGADAALSLGNKKAVDITVLHRAGETTTVDVKGVAGKWDWPADNIAKEIRPGHFLVFVSFEGKFDQPKEVPSVWVVPHTEVEQFYAQYQGRKNISRKRLCDSGERYRDRWDFLLAPAQATVGTE